VYNLIIAYVLIAVVLIGYGATMYQRTRAVDKSIRALEEKE
jgi:hypothetical protein